MTSFQKALVTAGVVFFGLPLLVLLLPALPVLLPFVIGAGLAGAASASAAARRKNADRTAPIAPSPAGIVLRMPVRDAVSATAEAAMPARRAA